MSGKENNTAAASHVNSPTSAANAGATDELGENGFAESGDELGMDGSLTPHSQDGVPPIDQNDELYLVNESLG
jgi:hypothetical protein